MRFALLSLTLLGSVAFLPNHAYACGCRIGVTLQESMDYADAVFTGKVTDISAANEMEITATVSIGYSWKGLNPMVREITVSTNADSNMCGYHFEKDKEYLMFANNGESGLYVTHCSHTKLLESAQEDLAALGYEKEEETYFTDVSSSHPNGEAIAYVQEKGIVSGYPDGSYQPDKYINRAEFTKIVVGATFTEKAWTLCDSNHMVSFSDAKRDAWYSPFLCVAVQHKIIGGYPNGSFAPGVGINFAEAAKIIVLGDRIDQGGNIRYDRSLPVVEGGWYTPYVHYLANRAAIPLTISSLDQMITRGQMAEIIFRLRTGNMDKPSGTAEVLLP